MYRVSFGLVSLLLSVLLLARNFNLIPDPDSVRHAKRQAACEAIAIECALAARHNDKPAVVEEYIRTIARRNPEMLSVSVKDAEGKLLIDTGDHEQHWNGYAGEHSDPSHMFVTISRDDGSHWGRVEVCYRPLPYSGWWQYVGGSSLPLMAFVWVGSFFVTSMYLRMIFRRVDVSQAKVVPERVRSTLDTLAEGVLVLDKDGVIALANTAFANSVGIPPEKLRGSKVSELAWNQDTVDLKLEEHPWSQVLRDSLPQMGRVLGLRTEMERKTMSVNSTPIFGEDGKCRGALATFDDVTPIEKARAAADAANKAKGEFLANVSHEIRTPMNAIMGMTELVLEGSRLNTEQRECLGIVSESATALLEVINDLLDLSKIDAGKFSLDPIGFEFRTMLDDTLQSLALRAHKKSLEIACDIPREIPKLLVGDPVRLRQIIINLVGNAIKFTDQGEVLVRVRVEQNDEKYSRLHFMVSDSGIGIPSEKLQAIFEPFTQADGSTSRRYGGTGLGLTISSHLVTLMGGKLWAESVIGKGSVFHFTAQFENTSDSQASISIENDAIYHDLPILVVENNATTGHILVQMLAEVGMKPTLADGYTSALSELERAAATGFPYPMLLVDYTLPGSDAVRLVKNAISRNLAGSSLLMLPCTDMPNNIEICREIGADGYIRKPVKRADLHRALQRIADPLQVSKVIEQPEPRRVPIVSSMNILLVEDNEFNQRVAKMKLERWGHQVRIARSGHEALQALADESFDVMFTDIQMPDMDGYELTHSVRNSVSNRSAHLPIIAMTAHAMNGTRERCLEAGMDDYVSKPIRDDDLLAAMRRTCPKKFEVEETYSTSLILPSTELMPEQPMDFNEEAVLSRIGGNRAVLNNLLEVYYQDCQSLSKELVSAIQNEDGGRIRTAAHTIKGMVSFLGAKKAVDAALKLEYAGQHGRFDETNRLFESLSQELLRIEMQTKCWRENQQTIAAEL